MLYKLVYLSCHCKQQRIQTCFWLHSSVTKVLQSSSHIARSTCTTWTQEVCQESYWIDLENMIKTCKHLLLITSISNYLITNAPMLVFRSMIIVTWSYLQSLCITLICLLSILLFLHYSLNNSHKTMIFWLKDDSKGLPYSLEFTTYLVKFLTGFKQIVT